MDWLGMVAAIGLMHRVFTCSTAPRMFSRVKARPWSSRVKAQPRKKLMPLPTSVFLTASSFRPMMPRSHRPSLCNREKTRLSPQVDRFFFLPQQGMAHVPPVWDPPMPI
eukprot:9306474-Lingulodinium_polyedra.AAC.1